MTLNGGNSLGSPVNPPRDFLVIVILSATWDHSRDNSRVREAADKLLRDITDAAKAAGIFNRFIDLNHANEGQNSIAGYGRKAWEQLQAVKRKYDPLWVLRIVVPGGSILFG